MEILNETFINSKIFELLSLVLKYHYEKRKASMSYNEFKDIIIIFVTSAMKSLLDNTNFYHNRCDCVIKKMPSGVEGSFVSKRDYNLISLDEDGIKSLYLGNLDGMVTIFHELGHFKLVYETRLGIVNIDLVRIIKEKAITVFLEHNDLKIKHDNNSIFDDYYHTNYHLYSEEKIAEIHAVKLFIHFLELADIHISKDEKVDLKKRLRKNQRQYQNYLRDFRNEENINSNWLDLDEAFDFLIKSHPNWIILPQLSIEYYLDDNGNVKKRTKEELMELLKKESDPNKRQCIEDLLDIENKKILSKSDFIDYSNIEKALGLKFIKVSNNNDNY